MEEHKDQESGEESEEVVLINAHERKSNSCPNFPCVVGAVLAFYILTVLTPIVMYIAIYEDDAYLIQGDMI